VGGGLEAVALELIGCIYLEGSILTNRAVEVGYFQHCVRVTVHPKFNPNWAVVRFRRGLNQLSSIWADPLSPVSVALTMLPEGLIPAGKVRATMAPESTVVDPH
jgi:hypothetical protein